MFSWMVFLPFLIHVTLFMVHGDFVASDDTLIQPSLKQRFRCGAPYLVVLFEIFYDLWIPVVKTSDCPWAVLFFGGTRGHSQFKGFFGAKKFMTASFLAGLPSFTLVAFSVASLLKTSMASW